MYFRHFLISGLMVGVTMFLGNIAFAEKHEGSKKQIPPQAIEKVNGTVPANEKAQVPEQALENQGQAKPKQQPVKEKPSITEKSLPEQAKGKGNGLSTAQENNNGLENKKSNPNIKSKSIVETQGKKQVQSVRTNPQKKDNHNLTLYPVKDQQKDRDTSNKDEIPKSQMPNQTQRTSANGGKPNDRNNPDLKDVDFLDHWIIWNLFYDIQLLVKPYHTQKIWMSNQWMNAPPSPPPQVAPLLETISSN